MPAPTEFTVAQIMGHSDAPWKGNDGTMMMTHEVRFEGDEQTWKIYHPADDGVEIAAGATLKGWKNSDKGNFGLAKPRGSGGRSGGGQDSKNFDRRPEHPRNEARMIHTACLGSAPAYYTLLREEGILDKPEDKAAMLKTLEGIVVWLQKTYGSVLVSEPKAQMEIPADTDGLEPRPVADGDDIPF